jgi:hypothetical protein
MAHKYDERITPALISQTRAYLKLLVDRQRISVGDVVRQAVRRHILESSVWITRDSLSS